METKKFNKYELTTIKRTAQNVNPMVTRKNKVMEEIKTLQEEYNKLCTMQEQYEAPIKTMTGGYTTEDLVQKVVKDTGKTDKNGNPVKVTKYEFKYPDTIIPPVEVQGVEAQGIDLPKENTEDDNELPFIN